MKYVLIVIFSYYLLEAGRHFIRQCNKWDPEDNELPFGFKVVLWITIFGTCVFWPYMYVKGNLCKR